MSHSIYRNKLFVLTNNNRILPFVLYSDSSITSINPFTKREYHSAEWISINLGFCNLFPKKEIWEKTVKEMIERQIKEDNDFQKQWNKKYNKPFKEVTMDSYNSYADRYPSGSKYKDMKSFYSIRRAIPIEEFLEEFPTVGVTLEAWKKNNDTFGDGTHITLYDEDEIEKAEIHYQRLLKHKEDPDFCGISVSVYGLESLNKWQ